MKLTDYNKVQVLMKEKQPLLSAYKKIANFSNQQFYPCPSGVKFMYNTHAETEIEIPLSETTRKAIYALVIKELLKKIEDLEAEIENI